MEFKNKPYKHQLEYHNRYARREAFALLADMGTGKTFMIINNIAELYSSGDCDSALIFAPNGVHTNWTLIELKKHMPDFVKYNAVAWQSSETIKFKNELENIFKPQDGKLRIFTMNWEALQTKRGYDTALKFCETSGKLFIVCDESHNIKNPSSKRFKALMKLKPYSKWRRIMTGTPSDGCPFDFFSQFQFLDESILQTNSFYSFKSEYAELLPSEHRTIQRIAGNKVKWLANDISIIKTNCNHVFKLLSQGNNENLITQGETLINIVEAGEYEKIQKQIEKINALFDRKIQSKGKTFCFMLFNEINTIIANHNAKIARLSSSHRMPQIVERDDDGKPKYKNIDRLTKLISPHSYRVLKSECLDLPEKIYKNIFFELSKEQKAVYKKAEDELRLEFENTEIPIHRLTLITKLAQITSGYFISPTEALPIKIEGDNPKLNALESCIDSIINENNKAIIWARYTQEIKDIISILKSKNIEYVSYYGGVSNKDRIEAIEKFECGSAKIFVGNAKAGGAGITLVAANYVIYYSNDYSLTTRSQSEDRAHRIGQTKSVSYINLIGRDTIDEAVVKCLIYKKDIEDSILNKGLSFIEDRL